MQRQIRLKLDEVKDFVITASRCDFDIAKSIVGVLGLDLNRPLTVAYNGYNLEFEKMMNRLALAC